MLFSTRSEYGVMMLTVLARYHGKGPLSLTDIANQLNMATHGAEDQGKITVAYLEQIVPALRAHSFIESQRGAKGGYVLAQPPEKIQMGEVIRALEGRKPSGKSAWSVMPCANLDGSADFCGHEEICTGPVLWMRVRDAITQALDSTTLADMVPETRRRLPMLSGGLTGITSKNDVNALVGSGASNSTEEKHG